MAIMVAPEAIDHFMTRSDLDVHLKGLDVSCDELVTYLSIDDTFDCHADYYSALRKEICCRGLIPKPYILTTKDESFMD